MSTFAFDNNAFSRALSQTALHSWSGQLGQSVLAQQTLKNGHLPRWEAAVAALPERHMPCDYQLHGGAIHIECNFSASETARAKAALEQLCPWRKGPFRFDTITIDTEWQSDWKWNRLIPHIHPLDGRVVLDVGCGNGYHLWRMHEAGAACVLGIEPSLHYLMQFQAAQRYIQTDSVQCVPLPMENLPQHMQVFDTVFSMGVLYHRRDPHSHLCELHRALNDSGELVLETLIVEGEDDTSLMIKDRYANMRNVYELPTPARLQRWLREAGFASSRVVSVAPTDLQEQRRTAWMTSYSLAEALDPQCPDRTIEGYPRPVRAVLVCRPG